MVQVGKIIEDIAGFFLEMTYGENLETITHPSLKAACRVNIKLSLKCKRALTPAWLDAVEYGFQKMPCGL